MRRTRNLGIVANIACMTFVSAILVTSVPAYAAEWRYLTQTSDKTVVSVDIASIKTLPPKTGRDFEVVQIWVQHDYRLNKREKARKSVMLERVACDRDGLFTMQGTSYLADGSVLSTGSDIDDYDFKYEPATPDTLGYAVVEFACGRRSIIG